MFGDPVERGIVDAQRRALRVQRALQWAADQREENTEFSDRMVLFPPLAWSEGYGAEGWVYQGYTELPSFEGNRVVLGSWIVGGEAAGMLVRESDNMVTDYFSRVAPHVISDGLAPTEAQVAEWLAERVGPDAPTI